MKPSMSIVLARILAVIVLGSSWGWAFVAGQATGNEVAYALFFVGSMIAAAALFYVAFLPLRGDSGEEANELVNEMMDELEELSVRMEELEGKFSQLGDQSFGQAEDRPGVS